VSLLAGLTVLRALSLQANYLTGVDDGLLRGLGKLQLLYVQT